MVKPILILAGVLVISQMAQAATATFFPVADTSISRDDLAQNAGGTSDNMIVGHLEPTRANVPVRGLLRFDLSGLPPSLIVTSATVEVTALSAGDPNLQTQHLLHRMSVNWVENAATWNSTGEMPWEDSGGDYDQSADALVPITAPSTYTFASTAGLVGTVQMWATNGAANFGWMLRSAAEDAGRNARRFTTREAVSNRPKLVVGYFVPPPPVMLENPRVVGANFHFEFTALPGSSYTVQSKPVVEGGDWTLFSTHSVPAGPVVIPVQDALTATNRFYRVISP